MLNLNCLRFAKAPARLCAAAYDALLLHRRSVKMAGRGQIHRTSHNLPVTTVYKDRRAAYVAAELYHSMLPTFVPAHFFVSTVVTLLALAVQWILYV